MALMLAWVSFAGLGWLDSRLPLGLLGILAAGMG
jgi:hypothetical protein